METIHPSSLVQLRNISLTNKLSPCSSLTDFIPGKSNFTPTTFSSCASPGLLPVTPSPPPPPPWRGRCSSTPCWRRRTRWGRWCGRWHRSACCASGTWTARCGSSSGAAQQGGSHTAFCLQRPYRRCGETPRASEELRKRGSLWVSDHCEIKRSLLPVAMLCWQQWDGLGLPEATFWWQQCEAMWPVLCYPSLFVHTHTHTHIK